MPEQPLQWQIQPSVDPPAWFTQAIQHYAPEVSGHYAAQLLWQRGLQDPQQLAGFIKPELYQPASAFEFGQEMQWAVERSQQARDRQELVAIWGDFDADGITATAVLWEGLGQFFAQQHQLIYYIPNRLTESHGLSHSGIDVLAEQGCRLIITCDTGSTNLAEINYAQSLGIDIIITDHHTLPDQRPPVQAIINPRYLAADHPLAHLSGVAVAYKLVEALYEMLPHPQQPLENLLDLVAIGLIADLVQLTGDCRYLAQRGIERLQQDMQKTPEARQRPGVARLLEFCKKSGDRPTDISFGLGPRINAVSRIQGDASFCVELLTSRDEQRCQQLAMETELANARRKALQKDVTQQVKAKLDQLDLSTTSVIVLTDTQWPVGILGLVAGQVAHEYSRPTILLNVDTPSPELLNPGLAIARGSARSVHQIDLYQLVKDQEPLLHRFGGHPFAAGLSLPVENIPLFTEAINQQLRQQNMAAIAASHPVIQADLVVKVADLGKDLFRELKLLEPCGMGNPAPKLLIQNCWFENLRNQNIRDLRGQKLRYIKTEFEIWDDSIGQRHGSVAIGFPGVWWEHYREDIPQGRCDAIAELDYNAYTKRYEIRLIAVRSCLGSAEIEAATKVDWILDWRQAEVTPVVTTDSILPVTQCPLSWDDWQTWFRRALQQKQKLAIAYSSPQLDPPQQTWQQLLGIAKYLSRTGQTATHLQLQAKLKISDRSLHLGLQTLTYLGFEFTYLDQALQTLQMTWTPPIEPTRMTSELAQLIEQFLAAVREEQFHRQYFYTVPLSTIQAMATQVILNQKSLTPSR